MQPIVFVDMDDVLVLDGAGPNPGQYTSYQVIQAFKTGDLEWPELWANLVAASLRDNLAELHREFTPDFIVSSSWSNYLEREQMCQVFRRTGLGFVADNLHRHWTTRSEAGGSVERA